jgi:hypothetical protein
VLGVQGENDPLDEPHVKDALAHVTRDRRELALVDVVRRVVRVDPFLQARLVQLRHGALAVALQREQGLLLLILQADSARYLSEPTEQSDDPKAPRTAHAHS